MIKELPVHLLRGIRNLTPTELEKKLKEDEILFYFSAKWNNECLRRGVFFDLSQLHWANLSAIVQLTLLIENAKNNNIQVYVALPTCRNTSKELISTNISQEQKVQLKTKRKEVNNFLKIIDFQHAAECKHLIGKKEVLITEEFDFVEEEEQISIALFKKAFEVIVNSFYDNNYKRYNYKYIFPLTWINCEKGIKNLYDLEDDFERILSQQKRGLNNIDVLSLKNVVLSELVKNVDQHAGIECNYALLCIGLIDSKSLYGVSKNKGIKYSNNIEEKYIDWIVKESIESQVELYFGDSGEGLLSKEFIEAYNRINKIKASPFLKSNKLKFLQWAFDKWSTRKKDEEIRGTKGLYRINRIVNKYNGIFHIRTNEIDGGFQKGGYENSNWVESNDSLIHLPGTFVQVKLCPYNEVIKFNFNFEKNRKKRGWKSIKFELKENNIQNFQNFIKEEVVTDLNILLIIQAKYPLEEITFQRFLEDNLKLLSHLRHPNGIVVYISNELGSSNIENIVNSTNELILKEISESEIQEIKDPDTENVYDPVLVLEKGQNVFWFGGSQIIVNLLNEITKQENSRKKITELEYFIQLDRESKNYIRLHFQNDDSLVTLSDKDEFVFDFTNIPDLFKSKVTQLLQGNDQIGIKDKCTPRLEVIPKWHDVSSILDSNEVGFALALYINIIDYCKNSSLEFAPTKNTYILIDHNQQKKLAYEFAKLVGINVRNIISAVDDIDDNIPRRTKLFSSNDEVIILTTIISSSETIRRLVKYVKRDLASPLFVLCLANYREYDIRILHTWSEFTNIISIYQHYQSGENKIGVAKNTDYFKDKYNKLKNINTFISPKYEIEDKIIDIETSIILNEDLKFHIIKTKSLHYNHIGNYNGRHFTFYIDKEKILKNKSILWDNIEEKIRIWQTKNGIHSISLFVPQSIKGSRNAIDNCIRYLSEKLVIDRIEFFDSNNSSKIIGENIIFIDFGSLTGKSINDFIASLTNTKNLLMCILFAQLKNGELNFYKKINSIKSFGYYTTNESIQLDLFSNAENISNQNHIYYLNKPAKVDIQFIYDFPLEYFRSENCPICEHIRALENYKINQDYLIDFYKDRQRRLKIRERIDLNIFPYPCDFYFTDDDKDNELSSPMIMKMYEFRMILEKAKDITQYRIKAYDYVYNIYINTKNEIKDCESNLYCLLYLISNEVNWLQKEPLVFRDLRIMIADISTEVALMGISILVKYFDASNSSKTSSLKLAVRNKYAAITVLRSANKLRFCQSIARIIYTSFYENRVRDNLAQNSFYQIVTLFKNDYNKSKEYYKSLENEILKLNKLNLPLTISQKLTLYKINVLNQRMLKKLDLYNLDSDCHIIINLKKEINEHYYGISHPDPVEHFVALDFSQLEDFKSDVEAKKEDSVYFENFVRIQKKIIQNYEIVSTYIEKIVQVHLNKLSDNILEGKLFKKDIIFDKLLKTFNVDNSVGQKDRFTELIHLIEDDLNNLFIYYDEYNNLYNIIYDSIIKTKNTRNEHQDSTLIKILSYFPSDIICEINDAFPLIEFPLRTINVEGELLVFYPKNELSKNLQLIKRNIEYKKNEDKNISDIKIDFNFKEEINIHDKKLKLLISYNFAEKWDKPENKNGSLNDFKNELNKFNGDLENHWLDDSGIFNIQLNFIKYE